ncbi:rho guanine nucleotide exchange factor 1-like [Megalops cyprinoides]|uniref:rho guanine nucleotide exchange factor 1-like n=1 Tax=Megalops cyprinoides TaxID=118141 RepID=UPI001864A44C|nr:rho guanine nucleotide exchange factor 1-like [Megalops cyprinoides]
MSIIGAEDEFFENDLKQTVDDQSSHFNSVELLKDRPTHLLVFLQHVMLQFDCLPLLCYLHADLLKNLSAKETKKQFVDFVNTFLDKGAILRVPVSVPSYVSSDLDRPRPELEDAQKRYVMDVQALMLPEIMRQLEDFRQKRMMGMTPSEHELMEVENHHPTERIPTEMKEKAVAENLLEKLSDIQPTIGMEEEKYAAIFTAVVYYMKHLGVKSRTADSKKSRGFFRKKNPLRIFEDSTKSKQRFPNIPWIGGSNDVKPSRLENEGEKEKVAPPSRIVAPEPTPAPPIHRKSGANAASLQVPESSDGLGVSIGLTSSPDPSQTDTGPSSSRPDAHPATETGDLSPAVLRLSVWEPPPTNETPPEDSQDGDRRKTRTGVRRSESMHVERRRSKRGSGREKQSRSRSDVDLQAASSIVHPLSPSPHHASFSDSGASPLEGPLAAAGLAAPQEEVEPRLLELEQDPPNWREQASSATLSNLSKKEIKRQEVINELFITEHAHVRMLSVLQNVFFRPLERKEIMTLTELAAIFPSLDEIIDMHYNFYDNLKNLRQEGGFIVKAVGRTLLNRFSGAEGDWFQKLTARFCSHQSYALDQIKGRQKKDPQFNAFIQEAESKPQCRRLQLKDIIPIEMQRLTKYPLLLENIAKSTENKEEKESVQQAAECCRKILNHVNEEVKDMENLLTLKDYQRRLDTSGLKPSNDLYLEYKNIDLTQKKMIYEGPVTWRVTKEKALDVQCVLLGDLLVLLQKQDDKMVLKCQSKSNTGVQEGKQMLSPIIKLDSVFLREVATDRKAFYVIFTWDSGAQIYELVAHSPVEMKNWMVLIKDAVSELKRCGGSILGRKNLVLPGAAYSSSANQTSNSSSENGGVTPKPSGDRDGDSLSEGRGGESPHVLMDHLLANGFDLIAHSNAPQEKVANEALKDIESLRQLVDGSSPDEAQSEGTATEKDEGAEPDSESCPIADKEDGPKGDAEVKAGQGGGTGASTVISVEKMEEAQKQLNRLETHLRHLQSVEDEYHRLQELLSKFVISGAHLQ